MEAGTSTARGSASADEQAARMRAAGYEDWEIHEELDARANAEREVKRNTARLNTEGGLPHIEPNRIAARPRAAENMPPLSIMHLGERHNLDMAVALSCGTVMAFYRDGYLSVAACEYDPYTKSLETRADGEFAADLLLDEADAVWHGNTDPIFMSGSMVEDLRLTAAEYNWEPTGNPRLKGSTHAASLLEAAQDARDASNALGEEESRAPGRTEPER